MAYSQGAFNVLCVGRGALPKRSPRRGPGSQSSCATIVLAPTTAQASTSRSGLRSGGDNDHSREVALHQVGGKPAEATSPGPTRRSAVLATLQCLQIAKNKTRVLACPGAPRRHTGASVAPPRAHPTKLPLAPLPRGALGGPPGRFRGWGGCWGSPGPAAGPPAESCRV